MKVRSVYLAGPIDNLPPHSVLTGWRNIAELLLEAGGMAAYDPQGAFPINPRAHLEMLPAINNSAVRQCDALLAAVVPNIPSWGTPMEISLAKQLGKPVVLWVPDGVCPANLLEFPQFRTLTEAVDAISVCEVPEIAGPYFEHVSTGIRHPVYPGDVGYDLEASEAMTIPAHGSVKLPLGNGGPLKVACPEGYWFSMFPRSSFVSRGLRVVGTVVDTGYRGPLFAFVDSVSKFDEDVCIGERVAQIVFFNSVVLDAKRVQELRPSARGENGFGSSGK